MESKGIYLGIDLTRKTEIAFDKFTPTSMKTNNWLKMHRRPMKRKSLRKQTTNFIMVGKMGLGKAFFTRF